VAQTAARAGTALAVAAWRALELALAAALLVAAGPLLLAAAAAIRLDSPGPVLFRQRRVGMAGRSFQLLKLRTMVVHADPAPHRDHVRRLMSGSSSEPWAPMTADPRVTRAGRVLRRFALDELPQLWNVLRGDMSLVGPRPALPYEVELWSARQRRRLAVRPGITGLWQVAARGSADFQTMVELDLTYIARRSPWLDLCILARTPAAVLRIRSAR